jgi:hypothetical protein
MSESESDVSEDVEEEEIDAEDVDAEEVDAETEDVDAEEVDAEDAEEAKESAVEGALLFGVWDVSEIEYTDPSTQTYLTVTPIAHTMGRHASKQFEKSEISIVERLINRLMQTEENTGQKTAGRFDRSGRLRDRPRADRRKPSAGAGPCGRKRRPT